jgi:PadR family transcriptional regulator PadR
MKNAWPQLSGNLQGLILAVLEYAPLHGYGIAREIERRSADALSFGEGALYPALKTLEKEGFVEAAWDTANSGPARKVYRLTPSGTAELAKFKSSWFEYSKTIEKVLGGAPKTQTA